MLIKLTVKNFALISKLELEFGKELNILSGETGAGKSIIVDCIMLLAGGRYDKLAGKYGIDSGIGFALYLDQLSFYGGAKSGGTDAVVLYDDATAPARVVAAVKKFADGGLTAAAVRSLPDGFGGKIEDLRRCADA